MSADQLPTALNTSALASDTRQDTQEDDSSTQNNDVADLLPLNGVDTVPKMDAGDVFLGAGICQTTPQTGPPLVDGGADARMPNRWMNGMRSNLGQPSTEGVVDQESQRHKPVVFENENANFGRPRQNNNGIAPIAEIEEQRNDFLPELNPDVTGPANRPQDWLMTPPGTGIRLSESLLHSLPPTAYPSPMPGPGSSIHEFPQNPVWRREDSSVVSLPSHHTQSIPMRTRFPYQNARTGCSVLEVATPREDGTLLQPRVSTFGALSGSGSSHGLRQDRLRREQILFLSQNPLGPNTILRGQSCPPNNPSWRFRNTSPGGHSTSSINHPILPPPVPVVVNSLYSTYHTRPGIVRRIQRRLFRVGGRLCRSFLLWVLLVATFAGIQGFKERSTIPGDQKDVEFAEWSDSDSNSSSENEKDNPLFNAWSFKG